MAVISDLGYACEKQEFKQGDNVLAYHFEKRSPVLYTGKVISAFLTQNSNNNYTVINYKLAASAFARASFWRDSIILTPVREHLEIDVLGRHTWADTPGRLIEIVKPRGRRDFGVIGNLLFNP